MEGWSHFREDRTAAERTLAGAALGAELRWLEPGVPAAVAV
jgi:hypothetical protein